MDDKGTYGSIAGDVGSASNVKSRSSSRENSCKDQDVDQREWLKNEEISIEDALTDAGFNWVQVERY